MQPQNRQAVTEDSRPRAALESALSVVVTENIEDVAGAWRALEAANLELPGQSQAFVRAWLEHFQIPVEDRVFLVAYRGDSPVALMPLWRKRSMGVRVVTWLTGQHLGCSAPLVDARAFAEMTRDERKSMWDRLNSMVFGADLLCLSDIARDTAERIGLDGAFDALPVADRVYRSRFASWEDCDATQRNKHRRKIDRQQGARLEALGVPSFEVVSAPNEADAIIDAMFAQKAKRFTAMGIRDPFSAPHIQSFYKDAYRACGGVLHVLRLDGEVVAVRYNLSAGQGLFSLISSMTCSEQIQAGSPGKQNLLRVMQTAFDEGYAFVDMGKGDNDEKRLWTNEQIELNSYYRTLSPVGAAAIMATRLREQAKRAIKGNRQRFELAKKLRKLLARAKS